MPMGIQNLPITGQSYVKAEHAMYCPKGFVLAAAPKE
ncbi:hypothetical protein SAMN05518861_1471 [Mesorhizobium sp. YR577]|nr:hypothetical protein SAMN05518861_1471 [Mesorhizobium sp. YR577]